MKYIYIQYIYLFVYLCNLLYIYYSSHTVARAVAWDLHQLSRAQEDPADPLEGVSQCWHVSPKRFGTARRDESNLSLLLKESGNLKSTVKTDGQVAMGDCK